MFDITLVVAIYTQRNTKSYTRTRNEADCSYNIGLGSEHTGNCTAAKLKDLVFASSFTGKQEEKGRLVQNKNN